jgi:hypothetical protein
MDNEQNTGVKLTWFDKIFKPEIITLPNGHSTIRRRSRVPFIVALLVLAIVLSLRMTGFDLGLIARKKTGGQRLDRLGLVALRLEGGFEDKAGILHGVPFRPCYQVMTSCPSSVTRTWISHWALGMPSAV